MGILLTVDIGNTNITIGAFEHDALIKTFRIGSKNKHTTDELNFILKSMIEDNKIPLNKISGISMCSVVPPITESYINSLKHITGINDKNFLYVSPGVKTGIKINYDRINDVGADRIVDAVAGGLIYGRPLIIVDIGTATVFDAIDHEGNYIGGSISPGLEISSESMISNTSQLRKFQLKPPKKVIGKNTVHSLQSGFMFGFSDLISGMIQRFKNEISTNDEKIKVVATGGLCDLIAPLTDSFDYVDKNLTLSGLKKLYDINIENNYD